MALDAAKNFAKSDVSAGYASGVTSIDLVAGGGAKFPAVSFNAVWYDSTTYSDPADDPSVEVVRVTVIATDTLTITRAQEGTADVNHNTGGKTYTLVAGPTAKLVTDLNALTLVTDDTTTNATMYPVWVTAAGNVPEFVSTTKLAFNPSTGRLGVGVVPTALFHASTAGASGTASALFENTNAASNLQVVFKGAATSNANLRFDNGSNPVWYHGNSATADTYRWLNSNANGNAEVLTLTQAGALTAKIGLKVNSAATPAVGQMTVAANSAGMLSGNVSAVDNAMLGFDMDWAASAWTARSTTAYGIYKSGGQLTITGNSGLTPDGTFGLQSLVIIDAAAGTIASALPISATSFDGVLKNRSLGSVIAAARCAYLL